MIDDTFERDLRGMLARRDPGPPPIELAPGIQSRIAANDGSARSQVWRRLGGVTGVAAPIAAVVVLAIVLATPVRPSSVGGLPSPAPVDPAVTQISPGAGVVDGYDAPVLQLVLVLAALAGLAAVVRRTRRAPVRAACLAGLLAVLAVSAYVGRGAAVTYGGASGVTPVATGPSPDTDRLLVDGDGRFLFFLELMNRSRLPLEIRGLAGPNTVVSTADEQPVGPRFVAIQLDADGSLSFSEGTPFHPITVEPGAQQGVLLLGLAGSCTTSSESDSLATLDSVSIVYEQLTTLQTAIVTLPTTLVASQRADCRGPASSAP